MNIKNILFNKPFIIYVYYKMNIYDIYDTYGDDMNQLSRYLCIYIAKKEMYFNDKYLFYLNKYYDYIFNKDDIFLSKQMLRDDFNCNTNKSINNLYKNHLFKLGLYDIYTLNTDIFSNNCDIQYYSVSSKTYLRLLSSVNSHKSLSLYRYYTEIDNLSQQLVQLCIEKDNFMRLFVKPRDYKNRLFNEYIKDNNTHTCCTIV